jgi:hypothetical protein
MNRLITAMKLPGFSWPTCPEGGAGKPGFEKYADCPSGWLPAVGESRNDDKMASDWSLCVRTEPSCDGSDPFDQPGQGRGLRHLDADGQHDARCRQVMSRPLRAQPYYFDLTDEATQRTNRVYFDLRD